jgi:hypothetical protein
MMPTGNQSVQLSRETPPSAGFFFVQAINKLQPDWFEIIAVKKASWQLQSGLDQALTGPPPQLRLGEEPALEKSLAWNWRKPIGGTESSRLIAISG